MFSHLFRRVIFLTLWSVVAPITSAEDCAPNQIQVLAPTEQVPPPSRSASAQELEKEGDTLRAGKEYFEAIDYYEAALTTTPNNPPVLNKLGITELMLLRYKHAEKHFQHAIKARPDFAEAFNNLGATYYARQKYRAAIKQYQKALVLQPDSATFYSNLGTAYFSRKEVERAMSAYAKSVSLDPTIFERSSHSGVTLRMVSPNDQAHYHYVVAMLYAEVGDRDRSLEFLRRAMEEGYKGIDNVYTDPHFADLRKDARFTVLMNTLRMEMSN